MVFEDTTIGDVDFKIKVNTGMFTIERDGADRVVVDDLGIVVKAPTPRLKLEDTTTSEADFTLRADAGVLVFDRDGTDKLTIGATETTSTQPIRLLLATPKLTLDDATSGVGFSAENDAGTLKIKRASVEKLSVGGSETISSQRLRVADTSPRITFEDAGGEDFVITAASNAFEIRTIALSTGVMKTYFSAQFVPGASPRNEFSFNNYAGGTEVKIIPVDDAITSGDNDTYINVALGTQTRGVVQINRDQVGPRQGVLAFESNDGTKWFLWMTNLGQLRRSSTDPRTADLGVAAAVIGP